MAVNETESSTEASLSKPDQAQQEARPHETVEAGNDQTPSLTNTSHRVRNAVIGSIAGAAVIAGSIIGVESENHAPDKSPSSSSSSDPSRTPEASATPVESLAERIAAEQIPTGLSTTELGQAITSRFSDWDAATSKSVETMWLDHVKKTGDASADAENTLLLGIATQNAATYGPALFGESPTPRGQAIIDAQNNRNAIYLDSVLYTYPNRPNVYTSSLAFDSAKVVSTSGNTQTLEIAFTNEDNLAKNRQGTYDKSQGFADPNGTTGTFTVTVEAVHGHEIITGATASDGRW